MSDVALFLGCLGLAFSLVAVIAVIIDCRNRRRT